MLVKIYGASSDSTKGRYSPAECTGAIKPPIEGKPDPKHIVAQRALAIGEDRSVPREAEQEAICTAPTGQGLPVLTRSRYFSSSAITGSQLSGSSSLASWAKRFW